MHTDESIIANSYINNFLLHTSYIPVLGYLHPLFETIVFNLLMMYLQDIISLSSLYIMIYCALDVMLRNVILYS
jgi:hypothetical protein